MNQAQIVISDQLVNVSALFYISNNNYYMVYTSGEVDDNDFIILHIAKILQEVVNTQSGPQATGYLIGTTIASEDEYNLVKQDISSIIDARQNNTDAKVQFIDQSMLGQIKIRDTKIFRLKKDIFEQIFGKIGVTQPTVSASPTPVNNTSNEQVDETPTTDKNAELIVHIDNLINELNIIKNILQ